MTAADEPVARVMAALHAHLPLTLLVDLVLADLAHGDPMLSTPPWADPDPADPAGGRPAWLPDPPGRPDSDGGDRSGSGTCPPSGPIIAS